MLWRIVSAMAALIVLGLIGRWLQGRSPHTGASTSATIDDPRLGRLTYSPDAKSWEGVLRLSDAVVLDLSLSGPKQGPDGSVLDAARRLADRGLELVESIEKLVAEAATSPELANDPVHAGERAEMRSLKVDSLHVFEAGPPLSSMVFFKEHPAHAGVWRCAFDGERVFDFGVDR